MADARPEADAPEHYSYENAITWVSNRSGVLSAAGFPNVLVSSPPEFSGESGLWNPEQLLLAAANTCLMTTFVAVASKMRLKWVGYSSHGVAHLTKAPDGKYAITSVELAPVIEIPEDETAERAHKAIEKAEANCLISNSLKYPTTLRAQVRVAPGRHAEAAPAPLH